MKITLEERLKMCEEHVIENKSLSHISERYNNYDVSRLKYLVNLYKKFGKEPFLKRAGNSYRKDTKLLLILRVKNGESIRAVSPRFWTNRPSNIKGLDKKIR